MSNFDFIAIGDITTDAFIKLSDAHIEENLRDHTKELCLRYGDKVPYDSVTLVPAVGNSPNAAVAAAKLGLKSALVANIGGDDFGREDMAALRKEGVAIDFVQTQKGKSSNYHFVLWFGADRTILVHHEAYEYALPDIGTPKWIYLSSIGEAGLSFHNEIADYLDRNPSVRLAFQPGTFQMKAGYGRLSRLYKHSSLFFCNKEEAQRILETKEENVKKLMLEMHERGPEIVAITDGTNGAYAFDGISAWFVPPYPDLVAPVSRTGAGDAFSATFTCAIALGHDVKTALSWGPINSAHVVQHVGAQAGLLTRAKLEICLANAPESYRPQSL